MVDVVGPNSNRASPPRPDQDPPQWETIPIYQKLASKINGLKALGMSNEEIALKLKINRKTVGKSLACPIKKRIDYFPIYKENDIISSPDAKVQIRRLNQSYQRGRIWLKIVYKLAHVLQVKLLNCLKRRKR